MLTPPEKLRCGECGRVQEEKKFDNRCRYCRGVLVKKGNQTIEIKAPNAPRKGL